MPFTYVIDAERRLVHITASGRITASEAFSCFDEVASSPEFVQGMRVLSDHRQLDTTVSVGFVRMFLTKINALSELLRGSKLALVEAGAARYGMARMASMLSDPSVMELRAFRDFDEAKEWLEVDLEEES